MWAKPRLLKRRPPGYAGLVTIMRFLARLWKLVARFLGLSSSSTHAATSKEVTATSKDNPLPREVYDFRHKGKGLHDVEPAAFDKTMREVVSRFAASDQRQRKAMSELIDERGFYILLGFAN